MRGFGLAFNGVDRFTTTPSVEIGGVLISRSVFVNRAWMFKRDWWRGMRTAAGRRVRD